MIFIVNLNNISFFPDVRVFKRIFYRGVDTITGEQGEQLRKIEEDMFRDLVKHEVEAELGDWSGSKQQNQMADLKIAKNVKSSFCEYEKNRHSYDDNYFKFK